MILKQWGVECPANGLREGEIQDFTSCIHVRVTIVGLGDVLSSVNLRSAWYNAYKISDYYIVIIECDKLTLKYLNIIFLQFVGYFRKKLIHILMGVSNG